MTRALTLIATARDPYTGIPCRDDLSARALALWPDTCPLHVGDPQDAALCDYLGMAIPEIEVLPARGVNAHALANAIKERADLVITGAGHLPYVLAQMLGWPVLPDACTLDITENHARITSVTGPITRSLLRAPFPCIVTVSPLAPPPGPVVPAHARAGRIHTSGPLPDGPAAPQRQRHIPRPPVLPVIQGPTAWSRIRQIIGEPVSAGAHPSAAMTPDSAARQLLAALSQSGAITAPPQPKETKE